MWYFSQAAEVEASTRIVLVSVEIFQAMITGTVFAQNVYVEEENIFHMFIWLQR